MMKKILAAFLAAGLCIGPTVLLAQSTFTLSGKVNDAAGKPLDGATVYLYGATDSTKLLRTALADADGKFSITQQQGTYKITVVLMGYQPYKSTIVALDRDMLLSSITLTSAQKNLKEVNITAARPFVQQKIDRTVVNPESMLTAAGGTALEVLEKSPGVMVDENAAISLKGKGVTIFVDDKPTYLSGAQLESYLRSISASAIDQIELMPNPPARYDAAGNGGVINIRTKKTKTIGFNGGVNMSVIQGRYTKHNDNLNFNYRHNRLNVFGNLAYNRSNGFSNLDINRHFFTDAGVLRSNFAQNSFTRPSNHDLSGRLGADYYLSDKTTIGINLTGQSSKGNRRALVNSVFTNANDVLDSTIYAKNNEDQTFRTGGINLNYRHQYDKNGKQLSADADYIIYDTKSNQSFDNSGYNAGGGLKSHELLTGALPSDIRIYSGKIDYEHPLANGLKLAAGAKSSYTTTDNIANYFYTIGGTTTPDYDKTNHFLYEETIHAAYLNANRDHKRFSFQAGLRLENTLSNGHQLGNIQKRDSTFKRSYTNIFPTLYLQYKVDSAGKHVVNLNYGRRINRPYYQDLNPFLSPLDKFTYYTGNPFLRPSFTDNVELSHTYNQRFTTTLSYSRTRDDVNETIEIVNGIYYSRPGNIGRSTVLTASFNGSMDPTKWLNIQLYSRVSQIHSVSDFYTGLLDTKGTYVFGRMAFMFKPGKDWTAQIDGGYQSRITSAQFDLGDRGRMNIALSKKLNASTTIKLVGNDLLYTFKNTGIINNLKNTTANWRNLNDTRTVVLSLSYRFGKTIAGQRTHNADGAQSEQSRVKN